MRLFTITAVSSALVMACGVRADTKIFDNEDGDYLWFSGANWNPDGVPGLGDDVIVSTDGVVIAQSDLVEVSTLMCDSGLRLEGISGLTVLGPSQITNFEIQTSLNAPIIADGPLLIRGNSEFRGTPVFRGVAETTIDGVMGFGSGYFIDPGVTLNIAGTADDQPLVLSGNGGRAYDGAVCRITGTFLTRTGFMTSFGSGKWLVDGGELEMFDDNSRITSGRIQMNSGTLRATVGSWELNNHDIRGGTLEAIGGGFLRLNATTASSPRVDATRYSNDGIEGSIEIRGSVTLGPATNTITGGTSVLRLRNNTITLDGDLTNEGNLSFFGVQQIEGPGEIVSTGSVSLDGTLNTVARIESGAGTSNGSIRIGVSGLIDVGPGGVYRVGGDTTMPNNIGGRIRVAGRFENDPAGGLARVYVPVDLEPTGTLASNGGELQLRWGGVWSGGTLDMTAGQPGDAAIVMLGEGDPFQIVGDVTVTNSGLGALNTLFIGPGSGSQPEIILEGSLTADNATARVRAPEITGNGTITSRGAVIFERTSTVSPSIVNEALAAFNGQITFTYIENNGTVEQRGNIRYEFGSEIINNGTWNVESGVTIDEIDPFPDNSFDNNGTFQGNSSFNSAIRVRFNNNGTVIADNLARFTFYNALTTTLNADGTAEESISGNWIRRNNGRIFFAPEPTQIGPAETTPDEPHQIEGDGDTMPWLGGITRMRETEARLGDTTFEEPLLLECGSRMTLEQLKQILAEGGVQTDGSAVELEAGSRLLSPEARFGRPGAGGPSEARLHPGSQLELLQPVEFHSVVDDLVGVVDLSRPRPERGPATPPIVRAPLVIARGGIVPASGGLGSLTIEGDLEMGPGSELRVDTAGPALTDRLDVAGSASLAGRVVLSLAPEFVPEIGDEVVVMTATGGFTGAVADVDAPGTADIRWRARVVGSELRVLAACKVDLASPFGVLDLADISAFIDAFLGQHSDADLDGNGLFDLSDITAFVGLFSGGCG